MPSKKRRVTVKSLRDTNLPVELIDFLLELEEEEKEKPKGKRKKSRRLEKLRRTRSTRDEIIKKIG